MSILDERSVSCLDFSFVLQSLRAETVTKLGGQSFDKYQSDDFEVVSEMYRRVEELSAIVGYVPPMGTMDFLKALVPIGCYCFCFCRCFCCYYCYCYCYCYCYAIITTSPTTYYLISVIIVIVITITITITTKKSKTLPLHQEQLN